MTYVSWSRTSPLPPLLPSVVRHVVTVTTNYYGEVHMNLVFFMCKLYPKTAEALLVGLNFGKKTESFTNVESAPEHILI